MRARLAVAIAVAALTAGCYHNPLPDYAPRIQSMTLRISVPSRPYVYVSSSVHHGGILGAAEMVETGVSIGIVSGVRGKLQKAVPGSRIQAALEKAFHGPLAGELPFPIAKGPGDKPTARLEVRVTSYGIDASDAGADASYTFDTQARLVYLPQAKILWENGTTARMPVTWMPKSNTQIPTMNAAGTQVANLAMLQSAGAARYQAVFDALSHDAAAVLARTLDRASAN